MNTLVTLQDACALIAEGRPLLFAADEKLLAALPKGTWIAGTIPYFMSSAGGVKTAERLFVTQLPSFVTDGEFRLYPPQAMSQLPAGYPPNGASFAIVPASSQAHIEFAQGAATWKGVFDRPLVGWVAGVDLADLGKVTPKVFVGSGESSENALAVLHVKVPEGHRAEVDILNLFQQGTGPALVFPQPGFQVESVLVDGAARNFAEYIQEVALDTRLPLVADYNGAMINVSFQAVDPVSRKVSLYAPVFQGVTYRVAAPLKLEYAQAFQREIVARASTPAFACNCILNYLYGELEGKRTGDVVGPITFGEIAYMLLNQTMVYLNFVKD